MARPPKGLDHIDSLQGPQDQKRRLRVLLASLNGDLTVAEACAELGIKEARFHALRRQWLEHGLADLAPRPAGRPRRAVPPADAERLEELEQENASLRMELWAAEIREELALTMPHLLRDRGTYREKKMARKQRMRRRKSPSTKT